MPESEPLNVPVRCDTNLCLERSGEVEGTDARFPRKLVDVQSAGKLMLHELKDTSEPPIRKIDRADLLGRITGPAFDSADEVSN